MEPLSGSAPLRISENITCDFGSCNGMGWSLFPETLAEGGFFSKPPENIIHLIKIDIQNAGTQKTNLTKDIRFRDIFKWYGVPAMILLNTELDLPGDKLMEITLVYPERHFLIKYSRKAEIQGDKVVSCGQDIRVKFIILDNKEQLISLDAIAQSPEMKDLNVNIRHKSVEEATGLTIKSFYDTFSQKKEPCISTPINIWHP